MTSLAQLSKLSIPIPSIFYFCLLKQQRTFHRLLVRKRSFKLARICKLESYEIFKSSIFFKRNFGCFKNLACKTVLRFCLVKSETLLTNKQCGGEGRKSVL